MIVTATKGTITPDTMADLFVRYGYRSAGNGTYLSAFRFVADTFDIEYQETSSLNTAVNLVRNNNYVVVYKANTTVTILQNISSNVDRVRVNVTGRIAYINTSNYTTSTGPTIKNTVGQYKRLRGTTYLYSNSNLTGTRYTYLPLTQVKIIRNVSSNIDYVYVVKTGRYAYINTNAYK